MTLAEAIEQEMKDRAEARARADTSSDAVAVALATRSGSTVGPRERLNLDPDAEYRVVGEDGRTIATVVRSAFDGLVYAEVGHSRHPVSQVLETFRGSRLERVEAAAP